MKTTVEVYLIYNVVLTTVIQQSYSFYICVYINACFIILFSIRVYYGILNLVSCAIQQGFPGASDSKVCLQCWRPMDLIIYSFYNVIACICYCKLPVHSSSTQTPWQPQLCPLFCVSLSVSQISSFVSYFRFHI